MRLIASITKPRSGLPARVPGSPARLLAEPPASSAKVVRGRCARRSACGSGKAGGRPIPIPPHTGMAVTKEKSESEGLSRVRPLPIRRGPDRAIRESTRYV
jgi:hypothetical protein